MHAQCFIKENTFDCKKNKKSFLHPARMEICLDGLCQSSMSAGYRHYKRETHVTTACMCYALQKKETRRRTMNNNQHPVTPDVHRLVPRQTLLTCRKLYVNVFKTCYTPHLSQGSVVSTRNTATSQTCKTEILVNPLATL